MPPFAKLSATALRAAVLAGVAFVSACATSQDPGLRTDGINDPYEVQNRKVHAFNKSVDKGLVRPVAMAYASVLPVGVRNTANNFSDNLSMPGVAVNSLLQGKVQTAGVALLRFGLNSTIGFAGIFDAASEFNMPEPDTDFGETLAVWGVGEGAYIELPLLGPSTQRDAVGKVVDLFTNTNPVTDGLQQYPYVSTVLAGLNNRAKYGETIDSILYESSDSYSQTRLIYLQNSRFDLDKTSLGTDADPYEDPYDLQ